MEPQEQPTKAIFSFADELQRRQQRAEEQKAVWEQKQQRAAELYRSGQNPILAYIETMKPEADPARIKRAETAAKIAAWKQYAYGPRYGNRRYGNGRLCAENRYRCSAANARPDQ